MKRIRAYLCFITAVIALLAAIPAFPQPQDTAIRIASSDSHATAIHGPRIVGTTPGRPFLFLIPATGGEPLTYYAGGLPEGLSLDERTGIITGSLKKSGKHIVTLKVIGGKGTATRKLMIVGGNHKLALTPPMGWNSWNVWADAVDEAKVRDAAEWMVKSGLAAHGYQYINIDDTWEKTRSDDGTPRPNWKFGDMKALGDFIHSKGLKFGIYSSPSRLTSQGYEGSREHEEDDVRAFCGWGVDYLKYDWSPLRPPPDDDLEQLQQPFQIMREALDTCKHDIVYSISQRGKGEVWEWGPTIGANLWRTSRDLIDSWTILSKRAFSQDVTAEYAGPGHWNDLDMLVVGTLGWGVHHHPSKLTQDEQITHMTMWSLLASPLILGCDLSKLDQFTLDLLTNDELLDVDQDPRGKAAHRKSKVGETEVWARRLWDGTLAVGLFNRGPEQAEVTARWHDLDVEREQPVRDLWRRVDLGKRRGFFTASVPSHGAVLVKIGKPKKTHW